VVLQPTKTITASETQEARFAKSVGHGKSGVAFVNVYRNNNSTTFTTWLVETASQTGVLTTSGTFWLPAGTGTIAASGTGAVRISLSNLGEFVRWSVTTGSTTGTDFDVLVYFADT